MRVLVVVCALVACGGTEEAARVPAEPVVNGPLVVDDVPRGDLPLALPRAPGEYAPSMVAIDRSSPRAADAPTDGTLLADADSCSMCHPDAAAQWASSAHSFASFGNPIYRASIDAIRADLGKEASRHCGGCHDMPLTADGLMTADAPIPSHDLRSHTGVSCRLCHGVTSATNEGNGSYVWSAAPIEAPDVDDAASIATHKRQVTTKLDDQLCVSCHRGFLSPELGLPVHLTGVDEPSGWRNSAYTGNGIARIDDVAPQSCLDCHMAAEPVSAGELGAKDGRLASHRFVGGHTWMASMRGDREQLRRTQAKLVGVASIDVAGARSIDRRGRARWHLPADGAPVVGGTRLELDVVIRNLLAGHRFPGGLLDIQDTWVEVEVVDASGRRIASSGLAHARDPEDQEAYVLRTLVVDDAGRVLEEHEVARFRAQAASHTLEAREARAVRYALSIPGGVQQPLTVTARLQHRSRTLKLQAMTCKAARTEEGRAFAEGARGARDVELDPCQPQPITTIATTRTQLGAGAAAATARPRWLRMYEHGMALVSTIVIRLDEARAVLEAALAAAPDARARAMVHAQLGWVAAKQQRMDDALAHVATARELVAPASPAVLDAIAAEAYARVFRWRDAVAPARAVTERAPENWVAWQTLARIELQARDFAAAQRAAVRGLALAPRDPRLLEVQAAALAALRHPAAPAALAAQTRFRSPDRAARLRIDCSRGSARCERDRNYVGTIPLRP